MKLGNRRVKMGGVLFVLAVGASVALAAPEQARTANQFLDTIGVNIKYNYPVGNAYGNWDNVAQAVGDIGFRAVRFNPSDVEKLNILTARTGVKVSVIMQADWCPAAFDTAYIPGLIAKAKSVTGLKWIEGLNEPDGTTGWETPLLTYQAALYAAVKADPALADKPVVAPSFIAPSSYTAMTGMRPYVDAGNIHIYPIYGGSPATSGNPLSNRLAWAANVSESKPVLATEAGYHNAVNWTQWWHGVSETAAAKYYGRMYFDYFNAGVAATFAYELVDQYDNPARDTREQNFGLMRYDFSLKPAGLAMKNITQLLADTAEFAPGELDYTIIGGNSALRHALLQKGNGDFYLALWQDLETFDVTTKQDKVNPTVGVTLEFADGFEGAEVYRPGGSTTPLASYEWGSQLSVDVPDEVILVRVSGVPEPSGLAVLALGALLLGRRGRRQR